MTSRPGHKGNALTTGFCADFFMTHFQCTRAWRPQFYFSLVPGFSTQGLTFLPRAGFSHFSGINLCDGGSVSLTRLSPFVMVQAPWQPHANKDVFSSPNNSHPKTNKTKHGLKMNQFLSQFKRCFKIVSSIFRSWMPLPQKLTHWSRSQSVFSYEFLAHNDCSGLRGWKKGFQS